MGSQVVHFHILHFVSDIYLLVSSPMWNLEVGDAKEHAPELCHGTLQLSPDPQLARTMTFACRAHGMTSSLTQQTLGGGKGGSHEIFTNRSGDQ